jgi:glutathione peroxidase-family protein
MEQRNKLTCPKQYDRLICAELPDKVKCPLLYKMVTKHMMHGPCGQFNPNLSCSKGCTSCKNNYPRPFNKATVQGKDSYPLYQRREDDCKEMVRKHKMDNRWVVPYNPYLLQYFNCHINVETCGSIKTVKYLFKYIYKGHGKHVSQLEQLPSMTTMEELMKLSSIGMQVGYSSRSIMENLWLRS